jgi:hypothetical protein
MSRNTTIQNLTAAIRAPFLERSGLRNNPASTKYSGTIPSFAKDNTFEERWRNAANTDDIRALSVDANNRILLAESAANYDRKSITFPLEDAASITTQLFFIADQPYRVVGIDWFHKTQSSVSGTAYVEKCPSGTAPGSGTSLMSGTFDLHAIANATVTAATLAATGTGDSDAVDLQLAKGDSLGIVIAGTTTSLAGVSVTISLAPGGVCRSVNYSVKANADLVQNQYVFVANRAYVVTGIDMRWSTKSSTAGVKLTVTKDTGTTAAGGGTSLLSDNTNVGILLTQTANVVYPGTLTATAATLRLATGDRLSIAFSGATFAALVGLVVTITVAEDQQGRKEITYAKHHVVGQSDLTGLAAAAFFIADRTYEILDLRANYDVIANDGGGVTIDVTADSGTTAPGSGVSVTTGAFNLKSTVRTTQVATLAVLGNRFLLKGDRLSTKPAGTTSQVAGLVITAALLAR